MTNPVPLPACAIPPPFRVGMGLPTSLPSDGFIPPGLEVTMARESRYRSNPDVIDMIGLGMVVLTLALWLSFIFI